MLPLHPHKSAKLLAEWQSLLTQRSHALHRTNTITSCIGGWKCTAFVRLEQLLKILPSI
jgi:hypothetical protein